VVRGLNEHSEGGMAKRKDDSAEIQRLLEEKAQMEEWLEKIRAAGNKTPESVRAKVESDYRQRLDTVLSQLEGFGESLAALLAEEQERRDQLAEDESAREAELAEAELRYAVGEYADDKWEEVRGKLEKGLEQVRGKLAAAEAEIARLEGVIAAMEGGAAPEPEPEPEPEPTAEILEPDIGEPEIEVPVAELPEEIEPPPADLEPEIPVVEEEPVARTSQQTDAFDEMEFLRSVTEDSVQGPDAARASGMHRISSQDLVSPVDEITPESGGTESMGGEGVAAAPEPKPKPEPEPEGSDIGAEGVQAVGEQKGRPTKGTPVNQKTVKCGECGALNLPTEWYCERCGAELASL
jgi:hypothetical protein